MNAATAKTIARSRRMAAHYTRHIVANRNRGDSADDLRFLRRQVIAGLPCEYAAAIISEYIDYESTH